jgi:RimJ/RimL family protein N-acetyltransferase
VVEWDGTVMLTTPRLLLRTFRLDDLPHYAALNADPEVVRYLGGPLTREDSDDIAAWAQELYAREGLGLLAVERRQDGALLGMCGLHHHLHSYPKTSKWPGGWLASTGDRATLPKPRLGGWTTPSGHGVCRGSSRSLSRRTYAAWR